MTKCYKLWRSVFLAAVLCAGVARAQDDAGSNPALSDAQARLETLMDALKNAKDEAQADATMVENAKSELDAATVKFTELQTKAAANPSDGRAAQALEAMSQALKDSRSALDAAMAKNAAADAKLKTLEAEIAAQRHDVQKLQGRFTGLQGANAQPPTQPQPPALQQPQPGDPQQAQAWFDASAAQAGKPGHFIALVVPVAPDGKTFSGFRYDRFGFDNAPPVERLVTEEGGFFVRTGGKGWVESMNWGKSGDPVPAARAAELDALVEKAMGPLQPPDAQSGAVTWKPVADKPGTFEQVREKPASGDAQAAPQFEFSENHQEIAGTLLRSVKADWNWEGKPAKVTVNYFYLPPEQPPQPQQGGPQPQPGALLPEEEIAAALRDAMSKPLKVDVVTTRMKAPPPAGGNSAAGTLESKMERVRVAGIISGKDFDLTVLTDGVVTSRQIAVGNDAWTSADGGKTWRKQPAADRTYYDAALGAVANGSPAWALLMMMSTPPPGPAGGPPVTNRTMVAGFAASDAAPADAPQGGEALRRLSVAFSTGAMPGNFAPDILSYWLATKDGKPALRRITGMMALGKSHLPGARPAFADYGNVDDGSGVLPPPGNPAALPPLRAEDLLALAVKAMEGKPWHVVMTTSQQDQTGKDTWSDPQPLGRMEGIFSGQDFDLSGDMMNQHKWTIGVGQKVWTSGTIAGVWTEAARFQLGAQADGDYQSVHAPLDGQFTSGMYDIAGKEQHDGQTWLHIKKSPASDFFFMSGVDYWLLLDKEGKPVAVRRCIWTAGEGMMIAMRVSRNLDQVDYTPARPGEQIKAPPGE